MILLFWCGERELKLHTLREGSRRADSAAAAGVHAVSAGDNRFISLAAAAYNQVKHSPPHTHSERLHFNEGYCIKN